MKYSIGLNEEQERFLREHPDFDLQEWLEKALDEKILETKERAEEVNAVIAAAGYNPRVPRIDRDLPRAMLKIKGKTLLERQIEVLKNCDINDITVVRGFRKELFTIPGVHYLDNDEYETTGIFYSFLRALEKIKGKTVLLYGDIIFEKGIIERLIRENSSFAVVVDRSWRAHYHNRVEHTISEAELVEVMDGCITRMGRDIPYESAYGEFIGLVSLTVDGARMVKRYYNDFEAAPEKKFIGIDDPSKASLIDFFNALIEKGEKIMSVDIQGGWFEIDTFEDYRKSWTFVK